MARWGLLLYLMLGAAIPPDVQSRTVPGAAELYLESLAFGFDLHREARVGDRPLHHNT